MSDTLPLLRLLAGQLRAGMSEDDRHRWALVVDGIADGMMGPRAGKSFVVVGYDRNARTVSVAPRPWEERSQEG